MRGQPGGVGARGAVGGVEWDVGRVSPSSPLPRERLGPCVLVLAARRSAPSSLALESESPGSLRVSWTPPSGRVLHYRVTYALASGSGPEKSVGLSGAGAAAARGPRALAAVGDRAVPSSRAPLLHGGHADGREPRGRASRGARRAAQGTVPPQVSVPGPSSQVTLPGLLAATKYRVLVSAAYEAGESVAVAATGHTGE